MFYQYDSKKLPTPNPDCFIDGHLHKVAKKKIDKKYERVENIRVEKYLASRGSRLRGLGND